MKYESPVINGDGHFSRDFTYIDNVIEANQLAAITLKGRVYKTESTHEVFNIAFGEKTTLNELFEILKENLLMYDSKIKNIEITHGQNRPGDIAHSLANIEKAKKLLGYNPTYTLKEGLKLATKWYWNNLS